MRSWRALLMPFFAYTVVGAALGVLYLIGYSQVVAFLEDPTGFFEFTWRSVFGFLTSESRLMLILWLFGLMPAGLASILLCLVMFAWLPAYESRAIRVPIAALIGAATTTLFMSALVESSSTFWRDLVMSWPVTLGGALTAALLAYRWPRQSFNNAL